MSDQESAVGGLDEARCEACAGVCWGVFEEGEDAGVVFCGEVGEDWQDGLAGWVEEVSEGFG